MTLFIQNDDASIGSGTVSPLDASLDLVQICKMDTNYGEDPLPAPSNLIRVVYDPQVETGPTPSRLHDLVNTEFNVNPEDVDIVILAGAAGFTLNDGELLTNVGGTALPPGFSFGGTVYNPTTSIYVLYDITQNAGNGFCVMNDTTGTLTLETPNPVILYHELSHAFRIATNSLLDTTEPDCSNASAEEAAAADDENDMRDVMGLDHRDTSNHCAGACGGAFTCCIVASVASGSPFSAEVNELRRIRDGMLRRSEAGYDFFEKLHFDYYAFSPEVCRLMSTSDSLRDLIALYFVRPLSLCLNLVRSYNLDGIDETALGRRFAAAIDSDPDLATSLSIADAQLALDVLNDAPNTGAEAITPESPLGALWQLLGEHAHPSRYVRWALIDSIAIFVDALKWRLDGTPSEEIGSRLARRFDEWAPRLPLSDVWKGLSAYSLEQEVAFVKQVLLRSEDAQREFGCRLAAHLSGNDRAITVLRDAGLFREDRPT